MRTSIILASAGILVIASHASAVVIGDFPGLEELIARADAIVILRVDRHITNFYRVTPYSTHDCYIYQTLKGDIPMNEGVQLQLLDTRTSFMTPYAIGSTHLMFLTKKRTPKESTDFRTIEYEGANIRLSPFGHEKMPDGKNINEQIKSLLKRTVEYNHIQHEKEQAFLQQTINGTAERADASGHD